MIPRSRICRCLQSRHSSTTQSPSKRHRWRHSEILKPLLILPDETKGATTETVSKSARLLVEKVSIIMNHLSFLFGNSYSQGFIRPVENSQGLFHYLPLATKSIRKLTGLIDDAMAAVGAQRVSLPMLTPAGLWKASGRWDSMGTELLRTKDSHGRHLVFAPTHEEAITSLASTCVLSYKSLPLRLYQVIFDSSKGQALLSCVILRSFAINPNLAICRSPTNFGMSSSPSGDSCGAANSS